ncbi:MAG: hypothetical protein IPL27_05580 [Lewinellaceae bacterium]|nr:hypothetical protein [Lewinellaceae bacterium]
MYEDPLDQPDLPPLDPPPPMPLGKVVLLNFGIMLVYMTLSSLVEQGGSEAGLAGLIFDAFLLVLQVGINVIGGAILLFTTRKHIGRAMLLSGLLVGIIGFGACLGKASLY